MLPTSRIDAPLERTHRTLYRFGALGAGHFGHMVLREDGGIAAYSHPNEHRYSLTDGVLRFLNQHGEITSAVQYHEDANCFLSPCAPGHYLLPVLTLGAPPAAAALPRLLINTIPKSGTYFLEAALAKLGAQALRLHLAPQECHDYRKVSEDEMHRDPRGLALPAPAGAIAHLLRPGEMVVGHVDDHVQLDEAARAGVTLLHAVRDLREVLVSLYHFKLAKVAPVSPADVLWRGLEPQAGFAAFLVHFAERDIVHISRMAEIILARPEPILHFEDLLRGDVPPGLPIEGLGQALRDVRGQPTSTLSGRDRASAPWSGAAEEFFAASGLKALNERLGYRARLADAAE